MRYTFTVSSDDTGDHAEIRNDDTDEFREIVTYPSPSGHSWIVAADDTITYAPTRSDANMEFLLELIQAVASAQGVSAHEFMVAALTTSPFRLVADAMADAFEEHPSLYATTLSAMYAFNDT